MEKGSIDNVTRSYFTECVGVMMVYKKGDLQSLMELDNWFTKVKHITQFPNHVVFSLWCNDTESCFSDEITPDHKQQYMTKWGIPPELDFNLSLEEEDEGSMMRQYQKLVEAVRDKCRASQLQKSSISGKDKIILSTNPVKSTPTKKCCT